jgi:hypothetical protein
MLTTFSTQLWAWIAEGAVRTKRRRAMYISRKRIMLGLRFEA